MKSEAASGNISKMRLAVPETGSMETWFLRGDISPRRMMHGCLIKSGRSQAMFTDSRSLDTLKCVSRKRTSEHLTDARPETGLSEGEGFLLREVSSVALLISYLHRCFSLSCHGHKESSSCCELLALIGIYSWNLSHHFRGGLHHHFFKGLPIYIKASITRYIHVQSWFDINDSGRILFLAVSTVGLFSAVIQRHPVKTTVC